MPLDDQLTRAGLSQMSYPWRNLSIVLVPRFPDRGPKRMTPDDTRHRERYLHVGGYDLEMLCREANKSDI